MGRGERLRVAVVGVGHLGRFHAKIYAAHPSAELVAVVDPDLGRARAVGAETGTRALESIDLLPREIDAVSVVVPTALHAAVAVPLLERGLSCLIEKPLASNLQQADEIIAAARRGGGRLAVGHVERFQPGLRKVREWRLAPRFIECHRLAPFSFRSTDIGVVHDLMIHDLDLVLELMKPRDVVDLDAAGGAILTDREDLASVRLVFEGGARANVTASRVSTSTMRRFRLFSAESYVSLDFHKNYGILVRKGPRWNEGRELLRKLDPAVIAARPDLVQDGVLEVVQLELAQAEQPLQAELASFLECVQTGREPEVSGEDGRRALALAERIAAEIQGQGW